MKILVCVKVANGACNPFDESALECALRLSDDVTVLSMGPESTRETLEPLTRLGAKAVLLSDPLFAGSDTLATSYILSEAIRQGKYDLILCGRQSIDGDTAQVGPMLAARLGLPFITGALEVSCTAGGVLVKTRSGKEQTALPALITVERGYLLRFPGIFSKVSAVEVLDNGALHCDVSRCGLSGSPTRVLEVFENERGRRNCKWISMEELFPLIDVLKAKPRVPEERKAVAGKRLPCVWAVGEEVLDKAGEIAEKVVCIEKTTPQAIAARALMEKPRVILWNADPWGRKNAPIAAALLETGLCADCTFLETDGEDLFMYRPARGGNITAKIRCLTYPQMATVRTKSESAEILVSGGKGVADRMDRLYALAQKLGADVGASRGLVDMNKAPYDQQIGLTGKTVSPQIYLAVGISGAVHHTCAIEGSGTVIAVNPDRNARIFDYADYGIVSPL